MSMSSKLIVAFMVVQAVIYKVTIPALENPLNDGRMWPYLVALIAFFGTFIVCDVIVSFLKAFQVALRTNAKKRDDMVVDRVMEEHADFLKSLPDFAEQYRNRTLNMPVAVIKKTNFVSAIIKFVIVYTWSLGAAAYLLLFVEDGLMKYIIASLLIIGSLFLVVVHIMYIGSVIELVHGDAVYKTNVIANKYYSEVATEMINEEEENVKKDS